MKITFHRYFISCLTSLFLRLGFCITFLLYIFSVIICITLKLITVYSHSLVDCLTYEILNSHKWKTIIKNGDSYTTPHSDGSTSACTCINGKSTTYDSAKAENLMLFCSIILRLKFSSLLFLISHSNGLHRHVIVPLEALITFKSVSIPKIFHRKNGHHLITDSLLKATTGNWLLLPDFD